MNFPDTNKNEAATLFPTEGGGGGNTSLAWFGTQGASEGDPPTFLEQEDQLNTLDESVWETLGRDAKRIMHNLLMVVFPFRHGFRSEKGREDQQTALRNWDLWGPLIFTLVLAITLSSEEGKNRELRFSLVFVTVALGAVILTINISLIGGQIVFFQALCLLGYCLFPLNVVAILVVFASNNVITVLAPIIGFAWSSWASIPFISETAPARRKVLAVYPLVMFYMFIGYLIMATQDFHKDDKGDKGDDN
eukprot:TRINITY_DN2748_c0_g1_i1.p2 TRINITY_DN2748_c0_g1~~TRINITY_DN2748_c0_g1_i1.p2  ORF type:complete len:249 (+),score=29.06 TRINITY_DN2748_c0_g1_i1:209-955(+)